MSVSTMCGCPSHSFVTNELGRSVAILSGLVSRRWGTSDATLFQRDQDSDLGRAKPTKAHLFPFGALDCGLQDPPDPLQHDGHSSPSRQACRFPLPFSVPTRGSQRSTGNSTPARKSATRGTYLEWAQQAYEANEAASILLQSCLQSCLGFEVCKYP